MAYFKMQRIIPHGLRMPPASISLPNHLPLVNDLRDGLKKLSVLASGVFGQLNEKLIQLKNDPGCSSVILTTVQDMIKEQEVDCLTFRHHLDLINDSLNELEGVRDLVRTKSDTLQVRQG
jgi:hypothetical protein